MPETFTEKVFCVLLCTNDDRYDMVDRLMSYLQVLKNLESFELENMGRQKLIKHVGDTNVSNVYITAIRAYDGKANY